MESNRRIAEEDLAEAPDNVRRYLRLAGVIGKERTRLAHITHAGRFRTAPDKPWMSMSGVYDFAPEEPGFTWRARMKMAGVLPVAVTDGYREHQGRSQVRLASLLTVAHGEGKETDASSLGRLLSELVLVPTALVPGPRLQWRPVDLDSAAARLRDGDHEAEATFTFGPDGMPSEIRLTRYRAVGKAFELTPFVGRALDFRSAQDLRIPFILEGAWLLPEGEFRWVSIEVETTEYR